MKLLYLMRWHSMSESVKNSTKMITLLTLLLEGKKLSSNDTFASNTNQYFNRMKKDGIELVEVWKPNATNRGKHKERSLHQSIDNIKRAEDYLSKLL